MRRTKGTVVVVVAAAEPLSREGEDARDTVAVSGETVGGMPPSPPPVTVTRTTGDQPLECLIQRPF